MSQRLTLSTNRPSHRMRIAGWRKNGSPIWTPMGGDGTDDADDSKDAGASGDGNDAKDSDDGKDANTDKGSGDDTSGAGTVSVEEYERTKRRMQEADRAKSEAEKRLREREDKDKSDLELAQREAKEAKDALEAATAKIRGQAIRLAFLSSGAGITWHDDDDALYHAMRDDRVKDLEVDDEGQVDKSVLKKVAVELSKSKPYLVKEAKDSKSKNGKDSDDDDDGDGKTGNQPEGKNDKNKPDRNKLSEKYPALRR